MTIQSYKDLTVWSKSMDLVVLIYHLTEAFPKSELYGLTMQMRRASVSIPSNIAEGYRRGTRKDYRHFVLTAYGSGSELETQIDISRRLSFGLSEQYTIVNALLDEVMKMLNSLIQKLEETTTPYNLPPTH